jgi:hypothetical protein
MYAFGDSLVFLTVFGAVSTVPTALALVFLRQSRRFWVALSAAALIVASTSLAAVAAIVLEQQMPALTSLNAWSPLTVLRISGSSRCSFSSAGTRLDSARPTPMGGAP